MCLVGTKPSHSCCSFCLPPVWARDCYGDRYNYSRLDLRRTNLAWGGTRVGRTPWCIFGVYWWVILVLICWLCWYLLFLAVYGRRMRDEMDSHDYGFTGLLVLPASFVVAVYGCGMRAGVHVHDTFFFILLASRVLWLAIVAA